MITVEPEPTGPAKPTPLAVALSLIVLAAYFGFILLASLARPLMATVLFSGVSLGIFLAAGVLVLCMVLSSVFVVVSNRAQGVP